MAKFTTLKDKFPQFDSNKCDYRTPEGCHTALGFCNQWLGVAATVPDAGRIAESLRVRLNLKRSGTIVPEKFQTDEFFMSSSDFQTHKQLQAQAKPGTPMTPMEARTPSRVLSPSVVYEQTVQKITATQQEHFTAEEVAALVQEALGVSIPESSACK